MEDNNKRKKIIVAVSVIVVIGIFITCFCIKNINEDNAKKAAENSAKQEALKKEKEKQAKIMEYEKKIEEYQKEDVQYQANLRNNIFPEDEMSPQEKIDQARNEIDYLMRN